MSTLASRHLNKLLEALVILHSHGEEVFYERLFKVLGMVFEDSCHSFELFAQDGTHWGHTNVPIELHQMPAYLDRIAELAPTQNPVFIEVTKGVREPLRLSDFITFRQFSTSDFYQDIFKPVAARYQIAIPLEAGSCIGGITINRGSRDFSAEELELARILSPQIGTAFESDSLMTGLRQKISAHKTIDLTKLRRLGLTQRESEVACWLAEGKRDKEIAIILSLSPRTVHHFVASVLKKLSVETRTAAMAEIIKLGIKSTGPVYPIYNQAIYPQ